MNKPNPIRTLVAASLVAVAGIAATGCAVTSGQSSVGEYVDDAALTTRIKAKFAEDPMVSAMRIQVETLNGTVQLSGFASSQAEKDKAAAMARATSQVKDVRNNIIVRTGN